MNGKKILKIAVLGGGAWGTALAVQITRALGSCDLYLRSQKVADEINNKHTNSKYLGGIVLPSSLRASCEFGNLVQYDAIVIATPSAFFNNAIDTLIEAGVKDQTALVIASKGLYKGELLSLYTKKNFPENNIAILSGPTFAMEVIQGKISAVNIASKNFVFAQNIAQTLQTRTFITQPTEDIEIVQVAGLVKNIISIMGGILEGRGCGANMRAMLFHQGINEIVQLTKLLGGSANLNLVSVVGDIGLSFYSRNSRNNRFGFEMAQASSPLAYIKSCQYLVEGSFAAIEVHKLATQHGVELPIAKMVAEITQGKTAIDQAINGWTSNLK